MKQIGLFFLISIIFCLPFQCYGREALSLTTGKTLMLDRLSPVTRDVSVSADGNTVDVTYRFTDVGRDSGHLPGTQIWFFEGFNQSTTLGKPSLPVSTDILHIPSGMNANVAVIDSAYIDFPSVIAPSKVLPVEGAKTEEAVTPISHYTGFFPKSSVWTDHTGFYRGEKLLYLGISPVQYDMENQTARVKSSITYRVSFIPDENDVKKVRGSSMFNSRNDNLIGNIAINGQTSSMLNSAAKVPAEKIYTTPLLILTHPTHDEAVRQFAHWKRVLGFDVTVLSRNNWTPQTIKEEIHSHTLKHPELKYILILGSHKQIPAEYIEDTANYTDFYYSISPTTTEEFPVPDYALGRLPAQTAEQSMTMVKKIIDYELRPPTDSTFYKTALNCAGFECSHDFIPRHDTIFSMENQRFVKRSEEVRDYLISQKYKVDRAYFKIRPNYNPACYNSEFCNESDLKMPDEIFYTNYLWNASSDDVINTINNGCFMNLFSYHGTENGIETSDYKFFDNSDIANLHNKTILPIVFSINCKTGSFQYDNAFLPNLLSYNRGGAVAAFGFTNSSYTLYNDCLLAGMIDAIWPTPGFRIKPTKTHGEQTPATPSYRLGDILIQSKATMNSFQIWYDDPCLNLSKTSLEMLHCLGDPTMEIRTAYPDDLLREVQIRRRDNNIFVLVKQPSRISFFNEVTGEVIQCDGTGGGLSCEHPEYVTTCVSRSNSIPFIDYAQVSPYIQDKQISEEYTISADKVYMGSDVLYEKHKGDVNISNGAKVSIETQEIVIAPGTTISDGAEINIIISN